VNRAVIAFIACTLLAGCGSSPPVQFFELDAVHPTTAPPHGDSIPIQVIVVHIPPTLDRQEMVRETASTRLAVSDQHRWAAPLGAMATRVLTQDLAERLPAGMVIFPQEPAPPRVDDLVVDILVFDSGPTGSIAFDGSWSLVPNGSDTPLVSRQLHLRHAAAVADYAAQARAMSDVIGTLADSIVAGLPADAVGQPEH
jgi:hypothetical protein